MAVINKKMAVEKIATAMLAKSDIIFGEADLLIFLQICIRYLLLF